MKVDDTCKACSGELRVAGSKYAVKNDDTPDAKTRLYVVLSMECVNPNCTECGNTIEVAIEEELAVNGE